jgi:TIR domain/AcrB/AcrD/AcrF family
MTDFFISHTNVDRRWAEWIGWVLEAEGFKVILQAWDFLAGQNFVLAMQEATAKASTGDFSDNGKALFWGYSMGGWTGFGFLRLPVAPLLQVDYPTITMTANMPGASPATMAAAVATPLERHLGIIADVTGMSSDGLNPGRIERCHLQTRTLWARIS